ncbi:hypothetical protein [Saccharopolyspora spinosa]|uniref:hypothetical protein n=1 Tax=Saccharopolyspora spinosa TaxID=60894 RepID=UPI0037485BFE
MGEAAKLRQAVLRAITDGLLPSKPLRRLVWSENGIREAERRLAWADATKGREFPSGAFLQWREVFYLDPVPRPVWREVFEGLEESVKASVYYLVVQVLLGNEDAKAMVEGSGIVIPGPGPDAGRRLLEQIADNVLAEEDVLYSGVLRRAVGGAASEQFQAATGGVVPQLRLTGGPDAVREFMQRTAEDDVHFLVVRVPSVASQDAVRAEQDAVRAVYVKGNGAKAFLASGDFFGGGQAHYFLDTVQGDDRRIDPESTLPPEVIAAAVADLDWWVQQVGLRATAGAAMVVVPWRLCGVRIPQRLASFWVGRRRWRGWMASCRQWRSCFNCGSRKVRTGSVTWPGLRSWPSWRGGWSSI